MAGRPRQFDEATALEKAMELFWAKGYEAVGVRELTDAMGVCRQSFYDTFGDKRQLFLRAIDRYCGDAERCIEEQLTKHESPAESIRQLVRSRAKDSTNQDCRGCFTMNSIVEWGASDDEVAQRLRQNLQQVEKRIAKAVRQAQDLGEIDTTHDARSIASFVLFVCVGYSALGRVRLAPKMAAAVLDVALGVLEPAPATATG